MSDVPIMIEAYVEAYRMYTSTATTFIQLSTATLVASVVFSEKVLGQEEGINVNKCLIACWILMLIAIASGSLYQYVIAELMLEKGNGATPQGYGIPQKVIDAPGPFLFAPMMLSYYLGSILFVIDAICRLRGK